MEINLKNVEELIFFEKKIHSLLPEFRHLFDQWQMGQRFLGMKTLGQRSVFDFLNSLQEKHIQILEEYFNDTIFVNKTDTRLVINYDSSIDELNLCEFANYKNFSLYRNKNQMYVTFWR